MGCGGGGAAGGTRPGEPDSAVVVEIPPDASVPRPEDARELSDRYAAPGNDAAPAPDAAIPDAPAPPDTPPPPAFPPEIDGRIVINEIMASNGLTLKN